AGFTPRLTQHVGRGFFFFIPPAASTNRAGAPANPVVRCHAGLRSGIATLDIFYFILNRPAENILVSAISSD
ncbi:hypothetical protein, partial [Fibrobacter sp. UWB3]|uniref:hypothetical protein n=1 Tax=Fibrobacter sp. UWB3 TaxID=1964357 RepID=UPI001C3E5B3F